MWSPHPHPKPHPNLHPNPRPHPARETARKRRLGTQMAGRQMAYGQRTLAEMLPYQHTKRRRGTDEWEKNAESAELSKVKGHAERK